MERTCQVPSANRYGPCACRGSNRCRSAREGEGNDFPLIEIFTRQKSLSPFLTDLTEALKSEDALAALENIDGAKLARELGLVKQVPEDGARVLRVQREAERCN